MSELVSGRDADGKQRDLRTDPRGALLDPALGPPTGGQIVGDDASHPLGAATGEGVITVTNPGPGTAILAAAPTSTAGFPIGPGGSYTYRAIAVEAVKVYVPVGTTVGYGVHQ